MTPLRVFLDEDSCAHRLAVALRRAGIEVLSSLELDPLEAPDNQQLEFAVAERCLLLTANKAHFAALHTRFAEAGTEHWGIVIRSAQSDSPEALAAALIALVAGRDGDSFKNALLYI